VDILKDYGAEAVAPQLMWANILVICASLLLALFLLTLVVGWAKHFSTLARLSALVSLGTSIAAAIVAHHLYDAYGYWVAFLPPFLEGTAPEPLRVQVLNEINNANQQATVLGWVGVIMTSMLLAVGLLGVGRLVAPGRQKHLPLKEARDGDL
jgi:hypothetical protein